MGVLRNRVVPLGQTFRDGCPAGQPGNLPVPASGRERRSYQADSPTFGRAAATEAGFAVRVYIHPLVKVIIFPNLLFCSAVAPADWPGDARRDPGRSLWGQK